MSARRCRSAKDPAMINEDSTEDELDRRAAADEATEDDIEIGRLARLLLLEYGQQRKAAAKKLGGIPVTMLDKVVQAERVRLGLDSGGDGLPGSAVTFEEIEPWPEPVDGAQLLDDGHE